MGAAGLVGAFHGLGVQKRGQKGGAVCVICTNRRGGQSLGLGCLEVTGGI